MVGEKEKQLGKDMYTLRLGRYFSETGREDGISYNILRFILKVGVWERVWSMKD